MWKQGEFIKVVERQKEKQGYVAEISEVLALEDIRRQEVISGNGYKMRDL